jgi:hypothetical protein
MSEVRFLIASKVPDWSWRDAPLLEFTIYPVLVSARLHLA